MTCVMNPETAFSGPRPVCSTQGARRPCACSERKVAVVQSRHDASAAPAKSRRPRRPSRRSIRWPSPSPPGDQSSVPSTPNERSALAMNASNCCCHAAPSPLCEAVELGDVRLHRRLEEHRRAVGEGRGRREVGVHVLEPPAPELVAELCVRRRAHEQRMPRAHHLVFEPGQRVVGLGPDGAAETVRLLEHADGPAVPGEQRSRRERVDSGSDEHGVERGHAARLPRSPFVDMSAAAV